MTRYWIEDARQLTPSMSLSPAERERLEIEWARQYIIGHRYWIESERLRAGGGDPSPEPLTERLAKAYTEAERAFSLGHKYVGLRSQDYEEADNTGVGDACRESSAWEDGEKTSYGYGGTAVFGLRDAQDVHGRLDAMRRYGYLVYQRVAIVVGDVDLGSQEMPEQFATTFGGARIFAIVGWSRG